MSGQRHHERLWREAMAELAAVAALESPPVAPASPPHSLQAGPPPVAPASPPPTPIAHYRALYIRLCALATRLADACGGLIAPQQLLAARAAHELVLVRLAQVGAVVSQWQPTPPGPGGSGPAAAATPSAEPAWGVVALSGWEEAATDLRHALPTPELGADGAATRAAWLRAAAEGHPAALTAGTPTLPVLSAGSAACLPTPLPAPPREAAAVLIQRHVRGRQGRARAAARRRAPDAPPGTTTACPPAAEPAGRPPHLGAPTTSAGASAAATVAAAAAARSVAQARALARYHAALPGVRAALLADEGPRVRAALRADRMRWFSEQAAATTDPTTPAPPGGLAVADFYALQQRPQPPVASPGAAARPGTRGGSAPGGGQTAPPSKAAGKPAASGRGGKGAPPAASPPLPDSGPPTALTPEGAAWGRDAARAAHDFQRCWPPSSAEEDASPSAAPEWDDALARE